MTLNTRRAGMAAVALIAMVLAACAAHQRSAGTVIDDATITASVKAKMVADDRVKAYQIDVDTHAGVVTLSGEVDNTTALNAATEIARKVKGVKSVKNELRLNAVG